MMLLPLLVLRRAMGSAVLSPLSKLRKRTALPLARCREALTQFGPERLPEAEAWLRERAAAEGWTKALKLQSRPLSQGLLGLRLLPGGDGSGAVAVMLEANCETDFVARTALFKALVAGAANSVLAAARDPTQQLAEQLLCEQPLTREQLDALPACMTAMTGGGLLRDRLTACLSELGENMALRRALLLRAGPGAHLFAYTHPAWSAAEAATSEAGVALGRFGALLRLECPTDVPAEQVAQLGNALVRQVVGTAPARLGDPHSEDPEQLPVARPEVSVDVAEDEVLPTPDEPCLLYQPLLRDESRTVQQLCAESSATITHFMRYECAEILATDEPV